MSDTKKTSGGQRDTARARSASGRNSAAKPKSTSSRTSQTTAKRSVERAAAAQNTRNAGSGTGTRRTSTARRRRRCRQSPDFAKILLIVIAIIIAILCAAVGLKSCSNGESGKESNAVETTAEPETEIKAEITVNGISVNGLTKTEAHDQILAAMDWDLKVSYNGDVKTVENLLISNVDAVLEEAFSKGESGDYEVSADGLEEAAGAAAASLADGWDVQPKNGSINAFDKASGTFSFAGAENGVLIEREKLAAEILDAVRNGQYKKIIEAVAVTVEPEITEAEARESFKRIGTYTTTTTSNKARNENVRLAAEALNGKIIQPGEEFSFNLTTGNRTAEKGYKPAGAYVNGVLVEEPGGGVCQVSSTLYNAVVFAGLKTTERHAHSYEPSYVTPGEDAMVSYDGYSGPDMKFINNSKTAVGLKTSFSNQKLTVSVYGNPILEEGVTLSMVSTKVKELEPPAPTYEEDPTLEPGVEVEAKAATPGSRWVTNLVTKKDGVVVNEIVLHNSTYNGKSATIKRNTSGTVVSTEGESSLADESSGSAEGVTPGDGQAQGSGATGTAPVVNPQESSAQNASPGDFIEPSASAPSETQSPAEPLPNPLSGPNHPADVTAPSSGNNNGGGPGAESVGLPNPTGNTGGQAAVNASPAGTGLISPINP